MAILMLNSDMLPSEKEIEIFSKDGFTVDIVYGPLAIERKPERIENVTEIHWLFSDNDKPDDRNSVAIESDIKSCGQTIYTEWIQFMSITGIIQEHSH
jgi:hypothetical protein